MGIKTNITLYTEASPNGLKPTILLAELGLEYKLKKVDISALEQKEPWFVAINPNGRIPALTDIDEDGNEIRIFESGAILQYLVARYDKDHKVSYPYGSKEHWETTAWLMWQVSGAGPMQGQAVHFSRNAPEKMPYAINRYVNECRRLFRVLDIHLGAKKDSDYVVGDRLTVADISIWPWLTGWRLCGLSTLDEFPNVKKWMYKMLERPGFEEGRNAPGPHMSFHLADMSDEDLNAMAAARGGWVLELMKRDAAA